MIADSVPLGERPSASPWKSAVFKFCILSLVLASGCADDAGGRSSSGHDNFFTSPDSLTPVTEARLSGIKPYWLGEEFRVGSLTFALSWADTHRPALRPGIEPGLTLAYRAVTGPGTVGVFVDTFRTGAGGAQDVRAMAAGEPGAASRALVVGRWKGELFVLPAPPRPVNTVILFLDVGDMTVIANAGAGRTGVPGEDSNPLIDSDLLIDVMAQHLRPYPE